MAGKRTLTSQQMTFLLAVLDLLSVGPDPLAPEKAARRAGYSSPETKGPALLLDPLIRAELAKRRRTSADGSTAEDVPSNVIALRKGGRPSKSPRNGAVPPPGATVLDGQLLDDDQALEASRNLRRSHVVAGLLEAMEIGLGRRPIVIQKAAKIVMSDGSVTYEAVSVTVHELNLPAAIAAAARLAEECQRREDMGFLPRNEHAVDAEGPGALPRLSPDIQTAIRAALAAKGREVAS